MSDSIVELLTLEENRDILNELTDTRFTGRFHYNKSVYSDGCRGPLCRKKERDIARAARAALAEAEGRVYQPGRTPRLDKRDELLECVKEWHFDAIESWRKQSREAREADRIRIRLKNHEEKIAELLKQLEGLTA